jgi:hypothetical protein
MKIARSKFTVSLLAPLAVLLFAGAAPAQDQDNSVAAAARRTQEAKKDQPKAAKLWDNANLPTTGGVNVVGQQPPAAGSNGATDSTAVTVQADATPAPTKAELAAVNSDLATAKQRVADLKADLDLAQRKFSLDQSTYVSNPNHGNDRAGATALDTEKSDVDAKAEAVALAEKLLASAQAKADEANKQSAAAEKATKDQAARDKAASTAAAAQPAPAAPAAPASTTTPDSDSATVNR